MAHLMSVITIRGEKAARESGNYKMGEELHGSSEEIQQWSKGRANKSRGTMSSAQMALKKKGLL